MQTRPTTPARALALVQYLIAIVFAVVVLVPMVTAIFGGLKTNAELALDPMALPKEPQVQNYADVVISPAFWQQLGNSLWVMVLSTVGVVGLAAMAAYVFARLTFTGREALYNFFTLGLLFPAAVAVLPLYLTIRSAGLIDTHWGIILPQVAFGLPGGIVILRGFFAQLPRELEEAAALDGASILQTFFHVLLPIMRPALAALGVLTMVASWNAFFWPLLVLNNESLYTLPLGVMQFSTQYSTDYGRVLAFVTIAMLPTIAFYLLAERQIIAGLTAGSVKG